MTISMRQIRYPAVAILLGVLGACAHQSAAPVAEAPPPAPRITEVVVLPPSQVEVEVKDSLNAALASTVLYFDFDKSDLKPESEQKLQRLAEVLGEHPKAAIQIQGNCDERGTEEYNLHLGERRAYVARTYLVTLGINAGRIDTISYGFEHPVDPAHNEQAWAKNRRDDFVRTEKVSSR